jgi:citrate synthase
MDSALTLIADGRLYYRGQDAAALAREASIEQVAALLWTGDLSAGEALFGAAAVPLPERVQAMLPQIANASLFEQFQILLPAAALDDLAAYDLRETAVIQTGARIVWLMARIANPTFDDTTPSIGQALAAGWGLDEAAARLLHAALILCADHEFNVSSFTARCVASAGSTPYAVVSAGLAALQGVRHGGHTARVEAFLREIQSPCDVRPALAERLKQGDLIPGFGHRLYPDGDPRAAALLDLLRAHNPRSPILALAQAIIDEAWGLINEHPTIDFGLAVLARALDLPPGSGLALFALGRTVGWIGHALEQYATDRLIRPRARYVGVQPHG